MGQIDFSLREAFSWEEYCKSFSTDTDGWDKLAASSRQFMEALNLSAIHPHCKTGDFQSDSPIMGPLVKHDYHDSSIDAIVTAWKRASPALLAISELWLRLFASLLAPLGIAFLVWRLLNTPIKETIADRRRRKFRTTLVAMLALASSVVLSTDMYYVYEYGASYGLSLLAASSMLSVLCAVRERLPTLGIYMILILGLFLKLSYDFESGTFQFGGEDLPHSVPEGLYYNTENPLINKMVMNWPEKSRTYSAATGATPWTPTGDARTGIPFLMNWWPDLELTKVWVRTDDDEAVRLEVSFPKTGHSTDAPVYIIMHGLSGGSQEEFIKDIVHRVNKDGSTAIIMIARGLMDTPVKGWNVFHGARVADLARSAKAIRPAIAKGQSLVGAGFSMGAIILSNYVVRTGSDCALDAAISVSGTLDSRPQYWAHRAKRLWQPMLAISLREEFVIGKMGEKYRERLTKSEMLHLMRATHITAIDEQAVVTYNGYRDVMHYYSDMGAMGDTEFENPTDPGRLANLSIPLCVLHALDDPLVNWKTVADNQGLRHPSNLTKTGNGNLLMLLTKGGGHVGWPLGILPSVEKWGWMSGAVRGFVHSYEKARKET